MTDSCHGVTNKGNMGGKKNNFWTGRLR